jgi:hypothetical protein
MVFSASALKVALGPAYTATGKAWHFSNPDGSLKKKATGKTLGSTTPVQIGAPWELTTRSMHSGQRLDGINRLFLLLPLLIYAATAGLSWGGLGTWDAISYTNAALDLLENGATLGETHWALRYPLVLPMAASMAMFGPSELAATLPNIAYGAGLVVVSTLFAARVLGTETGVILGVLVAASMPLTLFPLSIEIRGPETFFVVLSLWLFVSGVQRDVAPVRLLGSGVCAALAFLCREVAAFVPLTLVLLSLLYVPRENLVVALGLMAAGFLAVIVGEMVFYTIASGDPLYRYRLSLVHKETSLGISEPLAAGLRAQEFTQTLTAPITEYFFQAKLTGPFAHLGLLAGVFLFWTRRRLAAETRLAIVAFGTASVLSYLLAALVLNLQSPRYFSMLDYFACLLLAIAIAHVGFAGWRKLSLGVVAVLVIGGPFIVDSDRGFRVETARQVAELATEGDAPISVTENWRLGQTARTLLRLGGMTSDMADARIRPPELAPQGALIFGVETASSCAIVTDVCGLQMMRDAGAPEFTWAQRIRSRICDGFPDLQEYICNWNPPIVAALYLDEGT